MNPAQLLAHFDRMADAPDAVSRLRRFILDLAVRGKVVEQNPADEPSSDLGVPEFVDGKDRLEMVLPKGWIWARVADVAETRLGKMLDKAKNSGKRCFYLRNTNVQWFAIVTDDVKAMLIEDEEIDKFLLRDGDVLICEGGHPGRAAVWRGEIPGMAFQKALHRVRPNQSLDPDFFTYCLAVYFHDGILSNYYTGVGIPHFTGVSLAKLVFPLPPPAEQRRIVEKVDELMALCDKLEAAQTECESRRDRLVRASLTRLNQPDGDAPTFRDHARCTLDHLSRLVTRPEHVKELRQTILNLAVRGKLVPQDPNDESAAVLLLRIIAEQSHLMKEGKIRKQDSQRFLTNEGVRFEIPATWVWTRLGHIGDWGSGSTPSRGIHEYFGGGITWLKSGELNDNESLAGSEETVTQLALEKCSFRRNVPDDILFAMYGATIGKVAILSVPAVTNQAVVGCTPFSGVYNRYLFKFLLSYRAQFHLASEGGAQPNVSKEKVIRCPFPLPPLAEQHRIVAKADELMAVCDQLESQLTTAQAGRGRLLESVLHEALQGR